MNKYNFSRAGVEFNASAENTAPKFRIVANAGSRMEFWRESVVVDMAGKINSKKTPLPIVYAHDLNEPIGVASNVFIENGELILEGEVLATSEKANLFVETSKKGLPWEASIGFDIVKSTDVKKGKKAKINGREEVGPLTIANEIELWECSIVLYGADNKTSSVVTAGAKMEENKLEPSDIAGDIENTVGNAIPENKIDFQAEIEKLREARAAENERVDTIERIARDYNERGFVQTAIKEGWTAERFELETLRASRKTVPLASKPQEAFDMNVIEAAFCFASGIEPSEKKYSEKILDKASKFQSSDFRDVIELTTGFTPSREAQRDGYAWLCEAQNYCKYTAGAVTTHSLESILANSANAVMLESFNTFDNSWREVFGLRSAPDFKAIQRWRLSSSMKYKERHLGGDFEQVKWSDEKWEIQAKQYGIQGSIDAIQIKNGEAMGVFSDTMRQLGNGASQTISEACWNLFLNPPSIGGTAFYSTSFETLKTSCALDFANLSAARVAFINKKQGNSTDTAKAKNVNKDERLGLAPSIVVVPTSLEDTALMLLNGAWLNNGATTNNIADVNPNRGRYKVVSSPYLEANSSTSWYMLVRPGVLSAFEAVFVDGKQAPTLRSDQIDIGSLGVKFDAHINFGVGAFDYRAIQKMTA